MAELEEGFGHRAAGDGRTLVPGRFQELLDLEIATQADWKKAPQQGNAGVDLSHGSGDELLAKDDGLTREPLPQVCR